MQAKGNAGLTTSIEDPDSLHGSKGKERRVGH